MATSVRGPGRYFADHRAMYRLSIVGSAGTAGYATYRAVRVAGRRRRQWIALAILEAAITAGLVSATAQTRRADAKSCM